MNAWLGGIQACKRAEEAITVALVEDRLEHPIDIGQDLLHDAAADKRVFPKYAKDSVHQDSDDEEFTTGDEGFTIETAKTTLEGELQVKYVSSETAKTMLEDKRQAEYLWEPDENDVEIGDKVILSYLSKYPELNGESGTVVSHDRMSHRFAVKLDFDGVCRKVKTDNMFIRRPVRLARIDEHQWCTSGMPDDDAHIEIGEDVTLIVFSEDSNLNGQTGYVVSYDLCSDQYAVISDYDGCCHKLKPGNIKLGKCVGSCQDYSLGEADFANYEMDEEEEANMMADFHSRFWSN